MSLPNFGLPSPDDAFNGLMGVITANDNNLEPVVNTVGNALVSTVQANAGSLNPVSATASRTLSARVGANTRAINPVTQAAEGTLAGLVANQGSTLEAMQSPVSPVPGQVFNPPPGNIGRPPNPPQITVGFPGGTYALPWSFNPFNNNYNEATIPPLPALTYSPDIRSYVTANNLPHTQLPADTPWPPVALPLSGIVGPNEIGMGAETVVQPVQWDNTGFTSAFWDTTMQNAGWQRAYFVLPPGANPPPSPLPVPSPPTPVPTPVPPPPLPGPTPISDQCIPICGITPSPGGSPPPLPVPPGSSPPPPGSPPPPPPPSAIPPAPVPVPPPLPSPVFNLIIPLPGTPEWCEFFPRLVEFTTQLGNSFLAWADSGLETVESFLLALAEPPDASSWGLLGDLWTNFVRNYISQAIGIAANIVQQVRSVIWAIKGGLIVFSYGNVAQIVGTMGFRALWSCVKNLELGSEVWILSKTKLGEAFPEIDRLLEYLTNQLTPINVPSPPEAMEAFLQGQISRPIYECWLLIHGNHPAIFEPVLRSRRDRLQPQEMIQWARRNDIPTDGQVALLQSIGWYDQSEASNRVELYDELPTISDHLHWLQRNVFDAAYVQEFALMEGFEEKFWPVFGHDLHALGMKKEYAALHYAAHWINPAPEQLKEMVYRLRPEKVGPELAFTSEQYARVLAEQDVGPFFRPRFQEIINRIPALSYLRDMYRNYVITDTDMVGYHQDLGYSLSDSERFVAIDKIVRTRMRASESHGWTPAALANAFSIRAVDETTVYSYMEELGYTPDEANELMERADVELQRSVFLRARSRALNAIVTEIKQALQVGTIHVTQAAKMLNDAGWPLEQATALANAESAAAATARTKQVVEAVRKAFLRGEIAAPTALGLLAQAGIDPDVQTQYLSIWALQQTPNRKRRTASQIVNDVASGMLSTDEALVRLINLGYDEADSMLYLADANAKIAQRQAKMVAQGQRADKSAQANLAKIARDSQRQARQAIKRLEKIAPVSKLQKWAKLGIIGHDLFLRRMTMYGYDPATAEDYYKEACNGKAAKCVPITPPGTTIGEGEPNISGP